MTHSGYTSQVLVKWFIQCTKNSPRTPRRHTIKPRVQEGDAVTTRGWLSCAKQLSGLNILMSQILACIVHKIKQFIQEKHPEEHSCERTIHCCIRYSPLDLIFRHAYTTYPITNSVQDVLNKNLQIALLERPILGVILENLTVLQLAGFTIETALKWRYYWHG